MSIFTTTTIKGGVTTENDVIKGGTNVGFLQRVGAAFAPGINENAANLDENVSQLNANPANVGLMATFSQLAQQQTVLYSTSNGTVKMMADAAKEASRNIG